MAESIFARAGNGDERCAQLAQGYECRLAKGLAHVINIVDADAVVLGGGLSNVECLCANVSKLWRDYVLLDVVNTALLRAQHGDSSGVRGAARLWETEYLG